MDGWTAATLTRAARIPGEAARLVETAAAQSLLLRVTRSVAVHLHCSQHNGLMRELGRRPFYDIDFWVAIVITSGSTRSSRPRATSPTRPARGLREWGIKRQIFGHRETASRSTSSWTPW